MWFLDRLRHGDEGHMTARLSQPNRPPRRLGHTRALIRCCFDGCLDEISGRLLDQACGVIDLVQKMDDEIVTLHKPFIALKYGAFLVSNDQFCKLHGDEGSPFQNHTLRLYAASSHGLRFRQKENLLSLWCASGGTSRPPGQ